MELHLEHVSDFLEILLLDVFEKAFLLDEFLAAGQIGGVSRYV